MSKFKDKVAIVTGGASGIGRAVCEELGKEGTTVIVADIDTGSAEQVASGIVSAGGTAQASYLDVTSAENVEKLVNQTADKYGHLDYMFNNAGIAIHGEARDMNLEHWQRIIDINLMGVLYGTTSAYERMLKQGFGHIVNTSSILGLVGMGMNVLYGTTKHAIVGLSTSLRAEAAGLGVKVSVICPGFIQSKLYDSATVVNADNDEFYKQLPFKRMDVTRAAKKILKGVKRNKGIIVFPFFANFMWWGSRINSDFFDRPGAIGMKKFRSIRRES